MGSTLLAAARTSRRRRGCPYLESSKKANLAFYGRHGFVTSGDPIRPGDGPALPHVASAEDPGVIRRSRSSRRRRSSTTWAVRCAVVDRLPNVSDRGRPHARRAAVRPHHRVDRRRQEPHRRRALGPDLAFGRWMPDQLMRALPDDLRRSGLLVDRRAGSTHRRPCSRSGRRRPAPGTATPDLHDRATCVHRGRARGRAVAGRAGGDRPAPVEAARRHGRPPASPLANVGARPVRPPRPRRGRGRKAPPARPGRSPAPTPLPPTSTSSRLHGRSRRSSPSSTSWSASTA